MANKQKKTEKTVENKSGGRPLSYEESLNYRDGAIQKFEEALEMSDAGKVRDIFMEMTSVLTAVAASAQDYEEQLKLLLKKMYGSKADTVAAKAADDPIVVDELEEEAKKEPKPRKDYSRKQEENNNIVLSDFPVNETIVHCADSACPDCNGDTTMQDEPHFEYKLIYRPGSFFVDKHVFEKKVCPNCSDVNGNPLTFMAEDTSVLPGSYYSSSLLTHIIVSKYLLHLPLNRIEKYYHELKVPINRSAMSKNIIKVVEEYLVHLYLLMENQLTAVDVLYCDETKVQVVRNSLKKSTVFVASQKSDTPVSIYKIGPNGSAENVDKLLKAHRCYLHCDGSGIYKNPNYTKVLCWAHMRRKFTDAIYGKKNNAIVNKIIDIIGAIFNNEQLFKQLSDEERYLQRLEKTKPLVDQLFEYLRANENQFIEKSLISKAFNYALSHEKDFRTFMEDGRLQIDNNRSERLVKPLVQGRKNWLFMHSDNGADTSAILYSIVQTARVNNINVSGYLEYVLDNIATTKRTDLHKLLPWDGNIQALFNNKS